MSEEKVPVIARREKKFKLGIIGHGFVGQAVDYGFTNPAVEKFIVDPKYGEANTLSDLCEWDPQCVFICAPTPSKKNGSVDSSIVEEAVMKLIQKAVVPRDFGGRNIGSYPCFIGVEYDHLSIR